MNMDVVGAEAETKSQYYYIVMKLLGGGPDNKKIKK